MSTSLIDLEHISKSFDGEIVLDDLNLSIKENSFVTLLGPSGCGKTTTLRIIGGFAQADTGRVIFDGKDISNLPPNKRNLNTVFQKYALFPHMNIAENIAFGLKIKNKSKAYIDDKIKYALKLVNLSGYENRNINLLSGGQQQRIAIARAIVNEPKVLLLDEPLGALDLKLRQDMQYELIRLKNELGITFVYVTHDQEEALAISDRIAVMKDGIIRQIGSPQDIYARPYDAFVSTFIGHSNLFHGTLKSADGGYKVVFNDGYSIFMDNISSEAKDGEEVVISVRPEEFSISENGIDCKILSRVFLGKYTNYFLEFAPGMVLDNQPSIEYSQDLGQADRIFDEGESIKLLPNKKKINIFTTL
mgnify:CR=1 FL=1